MNENHKWKLRQAGLPKGRESRIFRCKLSKRALGRNLHKRKDPLGKRLGWARTLKYTNLLQEGIMVKWDDCKGEQRYAIEFIEEVELCLICNLPLDAPGWKYCSAAHGPGK